MKLSRFSDEQIVGILKEQAAGAVTADVFRRHGISEATFYKWKAKFGGLEVREATPVAITLAIKLTALLRAGGVEGLPVIGHAKSPLAVANGLVGDCSSLVDAGTGFEPVTFRL